MQESLLDGHSYQLSNQLDLLSGELKLNYQEVKEEDQQR